MTRVRVGVGTGLRQVAADPAVRAEDEQQEPDDDGEDDVAHPEGQQVERRAEQGQVHQGRDQEEHAQHDHHRRRRPRPAEGRAEQDDGDDQREGRQQAVGGHAEVALAVGGEEPHTAGRAQQAEDQQDQRPRSRPRAAGRRRPAAVDRPVTGVLRAAAREDAETCDGERAVVCPRWLSRVMACSAGARGG